MRMTATQVQTERKRQGRSDRRVENGAAGPGCEGTARSYQFRTFARSHAPLLVTINCLADRIMSCTQAKMTRGLMAVGSAGERYGRRTHVDKGKSHCVAIRFGQQTHMAKKNLWRYPYVCVGAYLSIAQAK
jgi:hypothetical protein